MNRPCETEEISKLPPVLYRLDYRDYTGNLLFRKEDNIPIDAESVARRHWDQNGVPKKPVIEILTEITAHVKQGKGKDKGEDGVNAPPGLPGNESMEGDNDQGKELKYLNVSNVEKVEMIVHSEHLVNAIRDVVKYYPGKNLLGKKMMIEEPYQILVHHRKELEEYKSTHPSTHPQEYVKECNEHIDVLLNFLETTLGPQLRLEEERHRRDPPVCTFEYLWLLFKPGRDAYYTISKGAAPIRPVVIARTEQDSLEEPYLIFAWNLKFDGQAISPRSAPTTIPVFDGEKPIDSLPLYPVEYHNDRAATSGAKTLKQELIEQGKFYWELSKNSQSYLDYNDKIVAGDEHHFNGRVIVDVATYMQFSMLTTPTDIQPQVSLKQRELQQALEQSRTRQKEPPRLPDFMSSTFACGCEFCQKVPNRRRKGDEPFKTYLKIDPKDPETPEPTDHMYFVFVRWIEGYILSERKWAFFVVSSLSQPTMSSESFEYLVLEEHIKSTIRSLIWKFGIRNTSVRSWSADLVKGKGEGQIFLLHGAPGVGKTCTAECVAELTQRPLLSLTCGDMGVTPSEVETNLGRFLKLGEIWGAIVLLDEADIYLEQRDTVNLKRNALVSVFLRALEYYKGILFLTTNRVGSFDEAFISRIHIPLFYKDLTDDDRKKIWENSFERLEGDKTRLKPIEIPNSTSSFAAEGIDLKWNGREIRNALQTAVALAEYDAHQKDSKVVRLEKRHLDQVVRMSKSFKAYLKETHGMDMSKKAKEEQIRADAFGKARAKPPASGY